MILGIMQPYIFPYVGYFQLVNAVDKFVLYDDVSYIKQGWINRNRILLGCKEHIFTVPLADASSFKNINQTEINARLYPAWKVKFMKTLTQGYSKAPNYQPIYELVDKVLSDTYPSISEMAGASIRDICRYLGVTTAFVNTSAGYGNNDLRNYERVLDICKKEGTAHYINPIGGQELYSKEIFASEGLKLNFVKSKSITYSQFNCEFVPWLSIIDLLMFLPKEQILEYLSACDLV